MTCRHKKFYLSSGRRGFTLVELLVVMSIISLLSGVVFASLSDGREKARMAGGKSLMAQADHALGYETVMSLAFDEGSGSSVADNAGNNGGTIVGAI